MVKKRSEQEPPPALAEWGWRYQHMGRGRVVRMARRWRMGLLAWVALVLGCGGVIGERFEDVDAIERSETWRDWVVVGHFGPSGPFELVDVEACEVSVPCSFSHRGQEHVYEGFDGFELTVLRLESTDGEVSHVVLRSRDEP